MREGAQGMLGSKSADVKSRLGPYGSINAWKPGQFAELSAPCHVRVEDTD